MEQRSSKVRKTPHAFVRNVDISFSRRRVKDVIKFPLLCLKPYRLGLRAANTETYKMAGTELKNFNFILLCIINSGMSLTFEHGRFMAFICFFRKSMKG